MIKRCLALLIGAFMFTVASATVQEEFSLNPDLSGAYMLVYPYPAAPLPALTAAPEGYVPFYINHYGRHGSRWLIGKKDYTEPIRLLEKADSAGCLTPLGKRTLADLRTWLKLAEPRLGELTDVGAEQHQGIARRMAQNFPEVFRGKDKVVRARSSVVIRCILSMMNETSVLQSCFPMLNIHTDASQSDMSVLADGGHFKKLDALRKEAREKRGGSLYVVPFERFARTMMFDTSVLTDEEKSSLIHYMRQLAVSLQNHKTDYTLYQLFTDEELFKMWANDNIESYIAFGNCPHARNLRPYQQSHLLREMITSADNVIANGGRAADLRFGHDVILMPLAVLMELDDTNVSIENFEDIAEQWQNYNIFPMACNIQMVFYRPVSGDGEVLVKVLLNEHEARLPVESDIAPYCKWSELRKYYLEKLEKMDAEYEKL